MNAQTVQLPPGCKIVEAPAPRPPELFAGYCDLLTPEDVAEITRQSAQTVRKLMRTGAIPMAFKIGAFWYVSKADFVSFIEGSGNHAA